MDRKPRILVLASGSKTGGGSGFAKMVEQSRGENPVLNADIVGVVSNHQTGGVRQKAEALGVDFSTFEAPFASVKYQWLVRHFGADYVMLSGWLKKVSGLEMAKTINIHPGPLPLTGGLYGHHVHEKVLEAYRQGKVRMSAVNMHFVDDEYDTGPIAFHIPVGIHPDDTADTLGARVNAVEHAWQSRVLNQIVHKEICLHGGMVFGR